jgi:hypothetical protein
MTLNPWHGWSRYPWGSKPGRTTYGSSSHVAWGPEFRISPRDCPPPSPYPPSGRVRSSRHAYAEENPHDRAVIACAHVENWFWHVMEDQHEQADKYFTRHDVQRDLRECWGRETRMAARTDYFRFPALNYYAWCLIQMQEEEMAREALDCMGAGVMERPWHYQTDKPVLLVNTARSHLDLPQI